MRLPVVALVALSSVAGLAAATAPLASVASPSIPPLPLPPMPGVGEAPALPDLPATSAPASPPGALALPLASVHLARASTPAEPTPVLEGEAPALLLPDGFAFLAPGAPAQDALRLDAAPLAAPRVAAPVLAAPRPAAPETLGVAAAAPQRAPSAASSPSTTSASVAAAHAFVAAPRVDAAGAAAAGAAIGVAALLGFALYHRIRPHATLENDTRKAIFEAVCKCPGLGVHVIAERAGVSYSTATYHLERLVAAGMIVMTPDGNKLCYYKNGGAFTEAERRILPLVKNDEAAKLLEAILDTPGTYRAELAERLGVTATTINWHLRRLREAGLIDEIRQGRNAYLTVRVAAIRESFLSLALKVEGTDGPAADRLRRFAGATTEGHAA